MTVPWWGLLAVAAGGAIGSVVRYVVTVGMNHWAGSGFPWGTLVVNAVGCLFMGLVGRWVLESGTRLEWVKLALLVGFLGGLTTFSSFAWELVALFRADRPIAGAAYFLSTQTLGIGLLLLGWYGGARLLDR